ncbi:MAG: nitroreductase family protein [Deltaproteobacteria bacterium]|nr:nitroreductase family protein [Candidatus Zymogenaceae bacterium]
MDALEAILTRRSIRKYKNDPVDEVTIRMLLAAAMSAPSARNQQCWRFVVVTDRPTLEALATVHPYAKTLKEEPLAVLVCGDLDAEQTPDFWVQDCAAATQNLLVAANALGLGTVWLGCHPRADRVRGIQELLGIPKTVVPLSLVAVGRSDEVKGTEDRYDEKKVHYDRW